MKDKYGGRNVRPEREKLMGCWCIISLEETKQKMVCISFHWEQKNRINYSLFRTSCIPQNMSVKQTGRHCFNVHMVRGRSGRGWKFCPRELKEMVKSQITSSCLSDSTLGMYFEHFIHIFNVVFFLSFSFTISQRIYQFKYREPG